MNLEYLSAFIPNSSGDDNIKRHMAFSGAGKLPSQLLTLAAVCGTPFVDVVDIKSYGAQPTQIGDLFNKYGSDKASGHDYDIFYDMIVRKDMNNIFEIGLGTNNEDVMSNMTYAGKPGASLRAFRDYCPDAMIYGADVDDRILFSEDRIKTFQVDQLDIGTLLNLYNDIPEQFDLIIDDGLHSPEANLNVLAWALPLIADNGWLIIEDIHEPAINIWSVVGLMLPKKFESTIIRAKQGYLFAVHRPS